MTSTCHIFFITCFFWILIISRSIGLVFDEDVGWKEWIKAIIKRRLNYIGGTASAYN